MAIASMASGVADVFGQMGAQKKQDEAYAVWAEQQKKSREDANRRQEASRNAAELARTQGVDAVSATGQTAAQDAESARLSNYLLDKSGDLTSDDSTSTLAGNAGGDVLEPVADKFLLAGQGSGSDTFKTDLAAKINNAAASARQRIKALATVSSYGPSFGGLDNYTAAAFQKSGGGIDRFNEYRRGDLGVYDTERAINPVQWSYTPGIRI
jgi:hypothetical protein